MSITKGNKANDYLTLWTHTNNKNSSKILYTKMYVCLYVTFCSIRHLKKPLN